ncbi:Imm32 family immunity protein [Sphingobium sp. WCS2017Hpa-17]|uniref:Imm32 family immunity protein n=1 Tax=Sphingobium sp. WCS2017Hpa-17 TaxID=3073638 RepID=UPI00288C09DC|nr:Imm32 family immunity protein [Sphingobium sp. WCS2017Hpa-17]
MISFEMSDADQLEIYLDQLGLAEFLAQIKLLDDKKTDHIHLMAESWGGSHLADGPVNTSAKAIRHVKMIVRE